MILSIISIVLLYVFTLYLIILGNIIYMLPSELLNNYFSLYLVIFFYIPLIAYISAVFRLIYWLIKKKINKNYLYSYLAFFPLFLAFYFWYYTQYDKSEFIPEKTFETRLQNIDVKKEENWLIKIWELYTGNDKLYSKIFDLDENLYHDYGCIVLEESEDCKDKNLKKSIEIYNLDKEIVDIVNNIFLEIVKYKYFKEELKDDEFTSLQWLSAISRISLFSAIDNLEKWNEDKAVEILLTYKKLWDKLLLWDNTLIWIIVWTIVNHIYDENIDYVLDNYQLSMDNLELLKNELNNTYDVQDIFSNAIKVEYWINKHWFENMFGNSSMLLNKEELYNERRNVLLNVINWSTPYDKINKNYFKRSFIYKLLIKLSFETEWHKEDIEQINTQRKELLDKINSQINNLEGNS